MSEEKERPAPETVVDRAVLAGMAGDAAAALEALRPGGKPPPRRTATGKDTCEISVKVVTSTHLEHRPRNSPAPIESRNFALAHSGTPHGIKEWQRLSLLIDSPLLDHGS
jgi:hypothetical protein